MKHYAIKKTDKASNIDDILDTYFAEYEKNQLPIQVNFRKLVDWVPYADSYTHYIHSYPAKLLKHIPIFFLKSSIILPHKGLVLDPFCGTGTVLLEALLANHDAIGADSNPLARLISRVKTTRLEVNNLKSILGNIIEDAKNCDTPSKFNVVNIDHWFSPHVQFSLRQISTTIRAIKNNEIKEFFEVCLSNLIKKVSLADPNLSVPVRLKPEKYQQEALRTRAENRLKKLDKVDVFEEFKKQCIANIDRMETLACMDGANLKVIFENAMSLQNKDINGDYIKLDDNSIDLIITSPPYAGAQKYIRSSSLNLGWLNYCHDNSLRDYEKQSIGREHYSKSEYADILKIGNTDIDEMIKEIHAINPLRAHINANYLIEMESAINKMYRVLKKDAYCILIIANNQVCGLNFETQKYINILAERIGFVTKLRLIDDIHSRGLMTKRNKTASIINSEWLLVLKK